MKKRIMAVCLVLSFVVAMSLNAFAAIPVRAYSQKDTYREASVVTIKDIERLFKVCNAQVVDGKKLGSVESMVGANSANRTINFINGKKLSNTEWVIRVDSEVQETFKGDYYVTVLPYQCDGEGNPINVPSQTSTVYGNGQFGPAWFYCGLFDEGNDHKICGYAVAQRITRWPAWEDLSYTTDSLAIKAAADKNVKIPYGNRYISGSYDTLCSSTWLETQLAG